jgi:hypothetical protein
VKEIDMSHDEIRDLLQTQIDALVQARNDTTDPTERGALSEAITLLQDEVDVVNVTAASALGAKVDDIVGRLDQIIDENPLDAASALKRSIRRLREFIEEQTDGQP